MISIMKFGKVDAPDIFARVTPTIDVASIVSEIISNVRKNGDRALFEYSQRFDKVKLDSLSVVANEIKYV